MTKDERDMYINDCWDMKKPARVTVTDDPAEGGAQQLIHWMDKMNLMPGHEFRQEMLVTHDEVTFDEIEAKLKELKFKPDGSIDTEGKLVIIDSIGFLRPDPPVMTEAKLSPAIQEMSDRISEEERLTREAVDNITEILHRQLQAFTVPVPGVLAPNTIAAAGLLMMESIAAQVKSSVEAMSGFCTSQENDKVMNAVGSSCPDYPPLDCGSNPLPMMGLDAQIKAHDKQWAETNKNGGLPIGQLSTFYGAPSRPGMSNLGGLFAAKYGLPKTSISFDTEGKFGDLKWKFKELPCSDHRFVLYKPDSLARKCAACGVADDAAVVNIIGMKKDDVPDAMAHSLMSNVIKNIDSGKLVLPGIKGGYPPLTASMIVGVPKTGKSVMGKLPDIDADDACECGAHKASGTPRGGGHSSWCPWAK